MNEIREKSPDVTRASRGLGWFSLALGAAELAMPRLLARAIGVDPRGATSAVLRVMGVREIAAGVAVLMQPGRSAPLWMRVAGDAVDLALLGLASRSKRTGMIRLAGAAAAVAGVTALDVYTARRAASATGPVLAAVTIAKPPREVYAFFRRLEQLPRFMDYLESVRELDAERSHWTARLGAAKVEWEARITEDRPGEVIAWESVPGAAIRTRGRVMFTRAPGRDMTEVRVELELGALGLFTSSALAKVFAKPQLKGDLRRLKQVLETGEVLLSDASAHKAPHPAQPDPERDRAPHITLDRPPVVTPMTETAAPVAPNKGVMP